MGNTESNENKGRMSSTMKQRFYSDYSEVRTEYEKNFGEAKIYKKNNTSDYFLYKRRIFDSEEEVGNFIKALKVFQSITHPNICEILFFNYEELTKFCSKTFGVELVTEFYDRSLEDLMNERKTFTKQQYVQFFKEEEVWDFMFQIFQGVQKLRDSGIFFDDIQPMNILIKLNEAGDQHTLKLLNPRYFLKEKTAYERKMTNIDYYVALSPKLMEAYKSRTLYPQHNPDKAVVWAIGVTILSMLCNENYSIYYDWMHIRIKYDLIENRLSRIRQLGYSSQLANLLEVMLCPTEVNRPNIERTMQHISDIQSDDESVDLTSRGYQDGGSSRRKSMKSHGIQNRGTTEQTYPYGGHPENDAGYDQPTSNNYAHGSHGYNGNHVNRSSNNPLRRPIENNFY